MNEDRVMRKGYTLDRRAGIVFRSIEVSRARRCAAKLRYISIYSDAADRSIAAGILSAPGAATRNTEGRIAGDNNRITSAQIDRAACTTTTTGRCLRNSSNAVRSISTLRGDRAVGHSCIGKTGKVERSAASTTRAAGRTAEETDIRYIASSATAAARKRNEHKITDGLTCVGTLAAAVAAGIIITTTTATIIGKIIG